jgi:hypothetical protein
VGNEENGYQVPDHNKTMINFTNQPSEAHKKIPQRRIMKEIIEKLMQKMLDMVNQKV